jgi:mannosyltransferase OCH1-like enzyme
LLPLARAHPDNTLVAVALLDALWRSAALTLSGAGSSGAPAIPRRIAQYWAAPEPPGEVRPLMQSWPKLNPDFDYVCFDDKAARAFLTRTCSRDVLFAYHRAAVPAVRADLFRLAYLAREGGVFVDADNACIAPLPDLLPPGAALVVCRERLGMLDNGCIAAGAEHPAILLALDQAAASINRGDRDPLRLSTGHGLLTRCVAQVLAEPRADSGEQAGVQMWSEREAQRSVAFRCAAAYRAMLPYRTRLAPRRTRGEAAEADSTVESQPWA